MKKEVVTELEKEEINLIKKLGEFKNIVEKSYKTMNPTFIANYAFQLSQIFNEFYHACPVLNPEEKEKISFRIDLVRSFKQVLKNALYLIGIETLEKM